MKSETPNPGKKGIKRMELEQKVLLHLKGGSAKWGALYSRFYQDGTGEILEALNHLADWDHIMVESDGTAKITESGRKQLQGRK
jgi:hypothetical protein